MDGETDTQVRKADTWDADEVARLLHAFNREYDEPARPWRCWRSGWVSCSAGHASSRCWRRGLVRALLEGSMEVARRSGADHFELTTAETDASPGSLPRARPPQLSL